MNDVGTLIDPGLPFVCHFLSTFDCQMKIVPFWVIIVFYYIFYYISSRMECRMLPSFATLIFFSSIFLLTILTAWKWSSFTALNISLCALNYLALLLVEMKDCSFMQLFRGMLAWPDGLTLAVNMAYQFGTGGLEQTGLLLTTAVTQMSFSINQLLRF